MNDSGKWLERRAWEIYDKPDMVKFGTDDRHSWSVPFSKISSVHYIPPDDEQVVINCELGAFIVKGPKVREFYDAFSDHKISFVSCDGVTILSVVLVLAEE
jgi:hypothetical protein